MSYCMLLDRHEAGKMLAHKLFAHQGTHAVVLALPRGGVVVGYEIADILKLPLDIIVVRKIGHPHYPEFAIGAIDKNGESIFNGEEIRNIDPELVQRDAEEARKEAARRSAKYRVGKPLEIKNKTVIIVDDGAATGLTLKLAVQIVKKSGPSKIVVAIPVMPADVEKEILAQADELVVLEDPKHFLGSVGAYYETFDQVEDQTVINLLRSLTPYEKKN